MTVFIYENSKLYTESDKNIVYMYVHYNKIIITIVLYTYVYGQYINKNVFLFIHWITT